MKNLKVNLVIVIFLAVVWGWKMVDFREVSPNKNKSRPSKILTAGMMAQSENETTVVDTLPLLTIMVGLERDIEKISAGIWRENYQMIEEGADNIANHPKIPPSEIKTIKSILGEKQFKGFVKNDKMVHNKSLALKEAAEAKQLDKSAQLFLDLEKGCISCHVDYREKIRASSQWN